MNDKKFKIAAVQASPVYMNREASVEKACQLLAEVAGNGAKVVVFPEAFIPGICLLSGTAFMERW